LCWEVCAACAGGAGKRAPYAALYIGSRRAVLDVVLKALEVVLRVLEIVF